ncbi:LPXTG cell wall anchor domain-containing protein [Companilactobacillus muriivasis]|uniref:LPXTG cell wall anchor domain-containing protein n=1 Tax=Companilactobacillus muriivasis TaxID=3081444 RepID=UPI0030C73E3C
MRNKDGRLAYRKPFKVEKLWLAVPLVTVSIVAGLSVSTPVNAATNINSNLSEENGNVVSDESTDDIKVDSENTNNTNSNSDKTINDSFQNDDLTNSNNTDQESNSSENDNLNNSSNDDSINKNGSESRYIVNNAITPNSDKGAVVQGSLARTAAASESNETTDTGEDTTAPTPTVVSEVPKLSNFYIDSKSKVVLYSAKATAKFAPYISQSLIVGKQLYGFYLVLPQSITGNVSDFQTGADEYVGYLKSDEYKAIMGGESDLDIDKITVYQLNDTSDGRQVFYFKPNDGATTVKNVQPPSSTKVIPGAVSYADRAKMNLLITTGDDVDTTPKDVTFNADVLTLNGTEAAPNNHDLETYGVLYAGSGDLSSGTVNHYVTIPSSSLGSNIPDKNIVGITLNGIHRTLTYIHVNVTDTYNVIDSNGDSDSSIVKTGQNGSTYSRQDILKDLQAKYPNKYFTVNSGTMNDDIKWMPTVLEGTAGTAVAGSTYTITMSDNLTKLTPKDSTLIEGNSWKPSLGLDAVSSDGKTPIDVDNDKGISYTITDSNGKGVDYNDFTKVPGTYKITYSYTDSQGNVTTAGPTTITVSADEGGITLPTETNDLISGPQTTWDPVAGITIKDENGDPITDSPSYVIKNSDGDEVSNSSMLSTPGQYTVIYTSGKYTTTSTINVKQSQSAIEVAESKVSIPASPNWDILSPITSLTDENGMPITDKKDADIEVSITDANGDPVTTFNSTKSGTYYFTYTYTDAAGNKVSNSEPVEVTIKDTNSGNGSENNSSGTGTNEGSGNTGDGSETDNGLGDTDNTGDNENGSGTGSGSGNTGDTGTGVGDVNNGSGDTNDIGGGINTDDNSDANNGLINSGNTSDTNNNLNTGNILNSNNTSGSVINSDNESSTSLFTNNESVGGNTSLSKDQANGEKLPQTGNDSTVWYAQLGMILLSVVGVFGFKRKRN